MPDTMTKAKLLDELRSPRAEWETLMQEVGEASSRQLLKRTYLPQFVGDIDIKADYTLERRQRAKWEVA